MYIYTIHKIDFLPSYSPPMLFEDYYPSMHLTSFLTSKLI